MASNPDLWKKFVTAPNSRTISCLLLLGVIFQILLAFLDKYLDLFCLSTALNIRKPNSWPTKAGVWWMEHDWPSIIMDLATVTLFCVAGYKLLILITVN